MRGFVLFFQHTGWEGVVLYMVLSDSVMIGYEGSGSGESTRLLCAETFEGRS